jgi:glutathione S-transferase
MDLTLYYHPLASYCHKVLIALYENETPFEGRVIDLADAGQRAELQALWPLAKFPVIRDHARKRDLAETSVIIEYLDRHFPGKRAMIPADLDLALEVRFWDRIFDNYVQEPMQAIVGDHMRKAGGDMSGPRATLATAYGMADQQLESRTWIAGEAFSLADCAAAPALFYAGTVHPFPGRCTHLTGYFDRLVQRPSVKRVLEEAKPYFPLYPFNSAIPKRFL